MWADDLVMARAIAKELHKLDHPQERNDNAPLPEPPPPPPRPEAKFKPGTQAWFKALQRAPPTEANGISMNELARRFGRKPRPPRAPNQQSRRWSGLWWYWN